jgi:hypothetical protein
MIEARSSECYGNGFECSSSVSERITANNRWKQLPLSSHSTMHGPNMIILADIFVLQEFPVKNYLKQF